MDWISIINSLVTALLCSGGLYTIFTIREHKRSAKLDNDNKVIEDDAKEKENNYVMPIVITSVILVTGLIGFVIWKNKKNK